MSRHYNTMRDDMTMDTTDAVVVELVDVVKEYQLGRVVVRALDSISLRVLRGEFLAVTGPSGSGKSTLIHLIGGLDRPTSGRVIVDGRDISRMSEDGLSTMRRKRIGVIFQFFNLLPQLSAIANVELPMIADGVDKRRRRERARELLVSLGLEDRIDHRPDELSGGEQQRVAIARALANRPVLVLADEPTGNLDWDTGLQVVAMMKEAVRQQGGTLVMVTHNHEIAQEADRRVELRSGRVYQVSQ